MGNFCARNSATWLAPSPNGSAAVPPAIVFTPSRNGPFASALLLETRRANRLTWSALSSSGSPCSLAYTSTPPSRTQPAVLFASSYVYGLVGVKTNSIELASGISNEPVTWCAGCPIAEA